LLKIIEEDMLIVLSVDRQRKRSPVLLRKLNEMNQKCIDGVDYCMQKTPFRPVRQAQTGTEVRLNDNAMKWVTKNEMRKKLPTHVPQRPVYKTLREDDLEKVG